MHKFYPVLLVTYLLVLLIGSLPAIPLPHDQRLFVVSSGSMEPNLRTGSVVITKPQNEYRVSDIITFTNPNKDKGEKQTTTHRLEKIINQNGEIIYMTKGDANVFSDANFIPYNQIIGKVTRQIATLGYLINLVKSKFGMLLLVIIPGLVIITKETKNIFSTIKSNHQQTEDSKNKKEEQT